MHLKQITSLKSFQYFFVTVTCFLFFLVQTYEVLQEYLSKEKGTRIKFKPITQAEFPAFTACPVSLSAYNLDEIEKNGISGNKQYMNKGIWISNDTNLTPEMLYDKVVINMSEVMLKMTIKLRNPTLDGKRRYDLKPTDKVW